MVDIINHFKPKYFLLENVKMKKEFQEIITEYMGVQPIEINSALVSAQNRRRLYRVGERQEDGTYKQIHIDQPEDRGILLKDILEENVEDNTGAIRGRYINKGTILGRRISEKGTRDDYNKNIQLIQCLEVRATNTDKSNCLTSVCKDNVLTILPIGRHIDVYGKNLPYRFYTPVECERLQTVPDGYTSIVSNSQRYKMLGNGRTVDVIAHIFSYLKKPNDK